MSRRARTRIDKRDVALDLARMFGHGSPMPGDDKPQDDQQDQTDPWGYGEPSGPLIPIGPTDCRSPSPTAPR